ncbi:MAG TPA: sugar phosphate isomerase/epimerase, partial [Spirochaetales bacterium]|nr:sugar phosphate isomerase/epimerase [Spirochaetales bacterium]
RSVVRMRRLGTEYIRIMSYPNDGLEQREWRKEVFRRLKELTRIAAGENITLVHENCSGWGGRSAENLRILLEEMDSPNFQIVFDTGNPVAEGHPREESWSFYEAARPFIKHIHIKDCKLSEDGEVVYTYPAAGWSMVREIIADALAGGYKGAFSIEPHMAVQIHLGGDLSAGVDPEEVYLEFGRRTNKLLEEL